MWLGFEEESSCVVVSNSWDVRSGEEVDLYERNMCEWRISEGEICVL